MQVLHPPKSFKRGSLWNGLSYGIKNYGVVVTFNAMTSLPNFMKIYHLVQMLLAGDTQTEREHGDLISFAFLWKGNRIQMADIVPPEDAPCPDTQKSH
jgi:hypothetical protein